MPLKNTLAAYVPRSRSAKRQSSILGVAALALAGSAILVNRRAAKAEREHPAKGSFVTTDGVRLHYLERGAGRPVVFLHGNGAMVEDMLISGVIDHAARQYRAIAFDRPGFGHSERPRSRSAGRAGCQSARAAWYRASNRGGALVGHAGRPRSCP